jgi:hypothetical protein
MGAEIVKRCSHLLPLRATATLSNVLNLQLASSTTVVGTTAGSAAALDCACTIRQDVWGGQGVDRLHPIQQHRNVSGIRLAYALVVEDAEAAAFAATDSDHVLADAPISLRG